MMRHLQSIYQQNCLDSFPAGCQLIQVLWNSCQVIWEEFEPVGPRKQAGSFCYELAICLLEPCPSCLAKVSREVTCGSISTVVNSSLREGICLFICLFILLIINYIYIFKGVLVYPLLKKPSLDPTIADNFHPVSNLSFLGKIVEQVVMQQLQMVLNEAN